MLQFAYNQSRPSLAMLFRHDDAKREYLYDQGSKIVSTEAKKHSRPVISMRHDWRNVFPFEKNSQVVICTCVTKGDFQCQP